MYLIPFDDLRPRLQNVCLRRWHYFFRNFHLTGQSRPMTGKFSWGPRHNRIHEKKKKQKAIVFFYDRKNWWILMLQTYIYVAWWFSSHMSGYIAVIPVSNTSWVGEESVQHPCTLSFSYFIPTLTWVRCRPWSTFGPLKQFLKSKFNSLTYRFREAYRETLMPVKTPEDRFFNWLLDKSL